MNTTPETLIYQNQPLSKRILKGIKNVYPEVLFLIYLIPTKYYSLSEKLHLPAFVNPQIILFSFLTILVLFTFITNEKILVDSKTTLNSFYFFCVNPYYRIVFYRRYYLWARKSY